MSCQLCIGVHKVPEPPYSMLSIEKFPEWVKSQFASVVELGYPLPISRPIFDQFVSGKKQCVSKIYLVSTYVKNRLYYLKKT